ncbi:MAG: 5-formyltetrahydrofolate cyclo-ligase [Pseudonocardiaceae bacterium]
MPTGPDAKQAIRQRVWDRLWQEGASVDPHGRIPDFVGATASADRLAALPVWQKAHVLKANPDQAQLPVRARALREGKLVYMAVPKVAVSDMHTVDLIVCGSVAVNRDGVRIGKGAGYSDIEVGLLAEAGLIGPPTTIVTTVHQLQVLDESLPHDEHDFTVDYIITPEEIIHCGPPHRPTGVMWTALDRDKITAIPVLAAMANKR